MLIELPDDLVARLRNRTAEFGSTEADVIREALDNLDRAGAGPLGPVTMAESLAMIDRGMEDVRAGRTMSVEAARQFSKDRLAR